MIELNGDELSFSFSEISEHAKLHINFQRTLRLPDDARDYPLPPGLGQFPLRHVDDFAERLPEQWIERGGVMFPMYQSEALWLYFRGEYCDERASTYPFAIKVSTGKIDAVTGKEFSKGLHRDPQDYMVSPEQPWLDGYCVKKGVVRQFVAMPLGEGYSAEEQITRKAEWGGIQIAVYPMKRQVWERRFPKVEMTRRFMNDSWGSAPAGGSALWGAACAPPATAMGLSPGGRMKQQIYTDPFDLSDWDLQHSARCFVHIINSEQWKAVTGNYPPLKPPTAADYSHAGLPWFDYYSDGPAVKGSPILSNLKSVVQIAKKKGEEIEGNQSCSPDVIVKLRKGLKKNEVREGCQW
jgi:hypothetical protein